MAVFPENAAEYAFYGKVYPSHMEEQSILKGRDGAEFFFSDGCPSEITFGVLNAAKELLWLSPFSGAEAWTHFKVTLSEAGKFRMEFAYVPEDENAVGVFMRGGTGSELDVAYGRVNP